MSKKLPKVFVNKIDKKLENNSLVYYSYHDNKQNFRKIEKEKDLKSDMSIEEKIMAIFNSPNYVYKATVNIKLVDKTITKQIVGRNLFNIITIDNELIKISDIIDIEISE